MKSASYISLKKCLSVILCAIIAALLFGCEEAAQAPVTAGDAHDAALSGQAQVEIPAQTASPSAVSSQAGIGTAFAASMPNGGGTALGEADGVKLVTRTVFYPEGADEGAAFFRLDYTIPSFEDSFVGSEKANLAIAQYEEELLELVSNELLPYADGEGGAHTVVDCYVESVLGFTNIFFTQTNSFGDNLETSLSAIVLSQAGERLSLAAAAGVYDVEPLAAQQIFNIIGSDPESTFGDVTVDDIALAIDIYSGFFASASGFGVILEDGMLSEAGSGPMTFIIPRAAFYPDCVGDVITADEYASLVGPLNDLVAACALDYAGFEASSADPYIVSVFMTRRFTAGTEQTRFVAVDIAEYERVYASFFASPLPEDIYTQSDGTYLDGSSVMLPVYPRAAYALRIDDAVSEGDTVTLYGMICFGAPGTAESGELSAAAVTLKRSQGSACGFTFASLELR